MSLWLLAVSLKPSEFFSDSVPHLIDEANQIFKEKWLNTASACLQWFLGNLSCWKKVHNEALSESYTTTVDLRRNSKLTKLFPLRSGNPDHPWIILKSVWVRYFGLLGNQSKHFQDFCWNIPSLGIFFGWLPSPLCSQMSIMKGV